MYRTGHRVLAEHKWAETLLWCHHVLVAPQYWGGFLLALFFFLLFYFFSVGAQGNAAHSHMYACLLGRCSRWLWIDLGPHRTVCSLMDKSDPFSHTCPMIYIYMNWMWLSQLPSQAQSDLWGNRAKRLWGPIRAVLTQSMEMHHCLPVSDRVQIGFEQEAITRGVLQLHTGLITFFFFYKSGQYLNAAFQNSIPISVALVFWPVSSAILRARRTFALPEGKLFTTARRKTLQNRLLHCTAQLS